MSHEREGKEKSDKKSPQKSLKEKRAAKAAKRDEKASVNKSLIISPESKSAK